jgi:hypothetical protein
MSLLENDRFPGRAFSHRHATLYRMQARIPSPLHIDCLTGCPTGKSVGLQRLDERQANVNTTNRAPAVRIKQTRRQFNAQAPQRGE